MDLQLGAMSGLDATIAIRGEHPDARIIVLTMYLGDEDIWRALKAGAITYLLKDTLSDDLIRIIREVHAGKNPVLPNEVQASLGMRDSARALTSREVEVIALVWTGMRNKEIAAALGVSEETVQVHIKNIFAKLEALAVDAVTPATSGNSPADISRPSESAIRIATRTGSARSEATGAMAASASTFRCYQNCSRPTLSLLAECTEPGSANPGARRKAVNG